MLEAIQVTTTMENRTDADRIASWLVEQRLAACAQVSGPITSCYRWKGDIETAGEWQCTIKTTARAYEQVEQAIRELHPYDEPEIIATPIVNGSKGYLQWLTDEVDIATP
jgi:periplasmic divalent cation tolerance protein